MTAVMTRLEELRDALAAIPGIASCGIGLEPGISAEDYPLVRIVPVALRDSTTLGRRCADVRVYFGARIEQTDAGPDEDGRVGLEMVYAALLELETFVRDAIHLNGGVCRNTVADEDRLETYKIMAVLAEIETEV